MGKLSGMYCCPCGVETPCRWNDLNVGKVFQCPSCKRTFGHVSPRWGGSVWVEISAEDVEFHGLLEEPIEEEEDAT
jgi:hypothetical protein